MRVGIRAILASGKICKTMLLGLVTIALVIPRGDVALGQSSTVSISTTFDVPNSIETDAYGINGSGQIVGFFIGANNTAGASCVANPMPAGCVHGFLRSAGGTFITLDPSSSLFTEAFGINDTGQIVGTFEDASFKLHGFVRDPASGGFTMFDGPNASQTVAFGISGTGQIVGYFQNASGTHGFVRDPTNGTFTTLDDPSGVGQTFAYGVNGAGQIVGAFFDTAFHFHGFLDVGGSFTTIDGPNSTLTQAYGINNNGQIVGYFVDGSGSHGFLTVVGGTFTAFDVQNATGTIAGGINGTGQIAGWYGANNTRHGFLANNGKPDPKLSVPRWFQAGIPGVPDTSINNSPGFSPNYPGNFWATDTYDSTASTIRAKGCALTTLTIVANFWANLVNDPKGFSNLDPRQMNQWMGMYSSGDPKKPDTLGNVDWDNWAMFSHTGLVRVYRECPSCNNTFPLLPTGSSLTTADPVQTLVNILRNGNRGVPVIIPIQCGKTTNKCAMPPTGSNKTPPEVHWVVVTAVVSKNGTFVDDPSNINVNDPGDVTTKTLADVGSTTNPRVYNTDGHITPASVQASLNNIAGWKVYSDKPTNLVPKDPNTPQALGVYTSDPVEFILTDPQGRRTGYDPVTNILFQEIPTSAYSTAIYGDEQNPSTPAPPPFKSLDMANQTNGQYTLDVIGTGSGGFTVEVKASDAAGNWIAQTYSGTAAPGATSQFTFQGGVTTFAAFGVNNLAISPSNQAFGADGTFALGPGGTISPVTQPTTIQMGTFLATIPAGSFTQTPQGTFTFGGVVQGVLLAAALTPTGSNSYAFAIAAAGAPNLPSANPVDVRLAIGSNGGSTSVTATFVP